MFAKIASELDTAGRYAEADDLDYTLLHGLDNKQPKTIEEAFRYMLRQQPLDQGLSRLPRKGFIGRDGMYSWNDDGYQHEQFARAAIQSACPTEPAKDWLDPCFSGIGRNVDIAMEREGMIRFTDREVQMVGIPSEDQMKMIIALAQRMREPLTWRIHYEVKSKPGETPPLDPMEQYKVIQGTGVDTLAHYCGMRYLLEDEIGMMN